MAITLKFELTVPNPLSVQDLVPRFKNFGEDIYRALRDECEISICEIDTSLSEFHLRAVPKREARTIAAKVQKIAEKDQMSQIIKVSEVTDGQAAKKE